MTVSSKIKQYQIFAEKIILEAGKILLNYKNKFKIKKHKEDLLDIATDADYAVEKFLISSIKKQFPSHHILAEESVLEEFSSSDFSWIIDPLDGTKEYVRNIPLYAINLALEQKGKLILGLVYQPEINRLYSSLKNNGAYLNNQRVTTSNEKILKNSLIYIRLPTNKMSDNRLNTYLYLFKTIVINCYRIRNTIWDIEALCLIALGGGEAYVLPTAKDWCPPHWWDVASGILMVKEAGGKVTDFLGKPIINRDLTKGLIASNGKIHKDLLNLAHGFHS